MQLTDTTTGLPIRFEHFARKAVRPKVSPLIKQSSRFSRTLTNLPNSFLSGYSKISRRPGAHGIFSGRVTLSLRSVVDFLNKQMERSEVLLVEARQYDANGIRIVVPTLFGYTEQARLVKRPVPITPGPRAKWDQISFFAKVRTDLDDEAFQAIKELFDQCGSLGFDIVWGAGTLTGSFSVYERSICKRGSFLTMYTNGRLGISFGALRGTETAERARDRLRDLISEQMGIPVEDITKYPEYPVNEWKNKVGTLVTGLQEILSEFRDKVDLAT